MGITPHQTTSKVVTQRRTVRKASIVRRGIAAEFEHDFVSTPLGRTSFMASVAQMARSVQETANVEVLRALLHCHRYQQIYVRKHGVVAEGDLDTWHQRKAERFMISQKEEFGLEKLSTMIDQEQEQYGGVSNCWILGREVHDYCSLVPEGKIFYNLGGQEAVDRVNGRRQNQNAADGTMGNVKSLQPERMIGTTPVFLAKSYNVDSIGKAELLSRTVEVGIYNLMVDRTRDYSRYRSEGRNLRVYDNDIDSWSEIEFVAAIENCGVWDERGILINVFAAHTGRNNSHQAYADEEYDFLSFINPLTNKRQNIEHIGDMSVHYLTAGNLENAGQTLLNALSYHDPTEQKRLLAVVDAIKNNVRTTVLEDGVSLLAWADVLPADKIALEDLATRIVNLVGGENPIFSSRIGTPGFTLYYNFVVAGLRAAVRTGDGTNPVELMSEIGGADKRVAAEQKFLSDIIGAAVPEPHKPQLAQIVAQTDKPWATRGQSIKQLILKIQKEDPQAVPSLPNATHVDKWYNSRHAEFADRLATKFGAASQSVESAAAAGGEVRYFPVDAKLPAGFQYVNAASPSSSKLFQMPGFTAHIAASGPGQARAGVAPGARGADSAARRVRADKAIIENAPELDALATKRFANLATHIQNVGNGSAPLLIKWLAALYAMSRFTKERLMSFARNHIFVPIGLLLMRPHCTYRTRFGIKCAAGGKSGYTFFGHSDMQIEHEAARKVGMMHYTAYLSAVVLYPKNVYVVEDLFCEKYLGGMGVEFWNATKYKNTLNRKAKSIICAPLPPNCKKIEQKIDIRGRWYTEQNLGLVTQERFDKPLYPGAGRMNQIFGFYDAQRKTRQTNRGAAAQNFVCWQGMEWLVAFIYVALSCLLLIVYLGTLTLSASSTTTLRLSRDASVRKCTYNYLLFCHECANI